jgi:UDP-2,4-diacetamido-2,4,6-trideoxy-beta-L-altropyranose hydrolase
MGLQMQPADQGLEFRLASTADSAEVLAWRNDVYARSMMLRTDAIDPETHAVWFASSLGNRDRIMIVAQRRQNGGKVASVGIVRFDFSNGQATVAINMNPAMRGLGLAAGMLLGSERFLPPKREIILIAEIKSTNTISRRAFERAGYQISPELIQTRSVVRYHKRRPLEALDAAH